MMCGSLFAKGPLPSKLELCREGSEAVLPPVAIVWPCPLSVDAYVDAGRGIEVPRPQCPSCDTPTGWWSGYWRHARHGGLCHRLFIPRVRCGRCQVSHALLPAFLLVGRLDVVETIGSVIEEVASGAVGVRPAARRVDVPHTTAREWWRRFRGRAERLAVAFAALAVDLGGAAVTPLRHLEGWALAAMAAAWDAAAGLPGWAALGWWRFVSAACGAMLIATNTNPLSMIVGKRRFIPPVP